MSETLREKFVRLDKEKADIKKWYEEYNQTATALFDELGEGGHFQDEEGTVYIAEVPKGTFVEYKVKDIMRTRRIDETKGSLSLVKARELGYTVK